MLLRNCAFLLYYLAAAPLIQAEDHYLGKNIFMTCMSCHGLAAEGNPMLKVPPLAGQHKWYLKSQLKKFKEGIRGTNTKDLAGLQMGSMAMTLADEKSMDAVVEYIATFASKKGEQTLQGNARLGEKVFTNICTACHGADAKGNVNVKAPSLRNLPDWYMVTQLKNFKNGLRGVLSTDPEGIQMKSMAMLLADEQAMKDVAAYILSL